MKYLFLLLLVMGCGDAEFDRVEELKGFRVLGIVAATPEVAPGGASTLQLIVSDLSGGGRVITGTTVSCVDPGIGLGASVSCDHDPTAVPGSYTIDTVNDPDLGAANLFTGLAAATLNVTVPAGIFTLTGSSSRQQFNGVGYITIFNFSVDGRSISAFKRISATNRGSFNSNPTVTDLLVNGVAIAAKPDKGNKLKVATGAPETYNFTNVDGSIETRAEEFSVAWYVSFGELDKPKALAEEDTEYLTDSPGSTMVVMAIVRDDRGGVVLERSVLP